jgi:hypothetical protein
VDVLPTGEERRHTMGTRYAIELPPPAQTAPVADVHNVCSLVS